MTRLHASVAPARRALVLLALPLAVPCAVHAQDDVRALAPTRVAAQVAGGALATPVAFVASGIVAERIAERLGAGEETASRIALASAWAGAAAGTAAVPAAIGARGPGSGRYVAALGGAVAGGLASWALVRLNERHDDDRPCRVTCTLSAVAVFVLPSVGATIAYDASRRAGR